MFSSAGDSLDQLHWLPFGVAGVLWPKLGEGRGSSHAGASGDLVSQETKGPCGSPSGQRR